MKIRYTRPGQPYGPPIDTLTDGEPIMADRPGWKMKFEFVWVVGEDDWGSDICSDSPEAQLANKRAQEYLNDNSHFNIRVQQALSGQVPNCYRVLPGGTLASLATCEDPEAAREVLYDVQEAWEYVCSTWGE